LRSAGEADFSAENGSARTPRDGAGLIATDANASPRPDALVGEHLRVGARLLDGVGVVGPAGLDGDVAVRLEQLRPAVPAGRKEPQAMHEHDRRCVGRVRASDLRLLMLGEGPGLG